MDECYGSMISGVAQRDRQALGQGIAALAQYDTGVGAATSSYTTTTNCGGQ